MPTNLNALIRYKQIDSCLKNNRYGCTILKLIDACSDALEEFRGLKKRISERTVRDDIRVLKSEMLGFNAPIKFENGKYRYSEKSFNIFEVPILEMEILKEVYQLLKEKQQELEEKAVESVLSRIKQVLGDSTEDDPHISENDVFIKPIEENLKLKEYEDNLLYVNKSVESFINDNILDFRNKNIKHNISYINNRFYINRISKTKKY